METATEPVAHALSYETPPAAPPPPPSPLRETLFLAALTAGTALLAGLLLARGLTTWLEAASFVTGALCVWLTVRQNIWNFPLGMVNVATFAVVFFRARLYSDAALQLVFFALGGIGWYLWLFGGARRTPLVITRTPRPQALRVSLATLTIWLALWPLLRHTGDSAPLWDSLTTALSLGAQWLLDRKRIENWLLWITVDVIYVPLYLHKSLYLTSALYAVFLCMALTGLLQWRRAFLVTHALQRSSEPHLARPD